MKVLSKKEVRALAILLSIIILIEILFGGVRVSVRNAFDTYAWNQLAATAGACTSGADFALPVAHQLCKPAGQPPKGRDGTQCGVQKLPNGTTITGVCVNGCCKGTSYSSSDSAIGAFAQGLSGVGQSLLVQGALGLLNQLLGGAGSGAGGGAGGGSYAGGAPGYPLLQESSRLDFDTNADTGTLPDEFDLVFGDAGVDTPFADEDTPTSQEEDDGLARATPESALRGSTETEESVSTAYEYLRSLTQEVPGGAVDTSLEDREEFDQDFFGSSLPASEGVVFESGLSLSELEQAGLRQQVRSLQEGGSEVAFFNNVEDYRSSAVARSNSVPRSNPLSNERFDQLTYEAGTSEVQPTFWQQLVLFFAQLLGVAPSQ